MGDLCMIILVIFDNVEGEEPSGTSSGTCKNLPGLIERKHSRKCAFRHGIERLHRGLLQSSRCNSTNTVPRILCTQ